MYEHVCLLLQGKVCQLNWIWDYLIYFTNGKFQIQYHNRTWKLHFTRKEKQINRNRLFISTIQTQKQFNNIAWSIDLKTTHCVALSSTEWILEIVKLYLKKYCSVIYDLWMCYNIWRHLYQSNYMFSRTTKVNRRQYTPQQLLRVKYVCFSTDWLRVNHTVKSLTWYIVNVLELPPFHVLWIYHSGI